ncbi:murein biosynthesis integral membrane protein MurJ [Carboxydothermus pertinax]|uniref:Probable lipid II flippase MurJ n=1 Tax=Carboxydothermus pertinax TaxID=870242 RepID=A0A1L8CSZ1_9THEO|nr:murein biosynthesis integral membrane protein MurJ [Carboxydothermus pertinax]GAV22036.1 lipid II flippase MurJ [Carboxydothermus pertinax]
MSTRKNVAKAAGIILVMGILSRILGFVREQLLAVKFGATGISDAYVAAFTIPDFLYNLLVGGALSAAFIPVFSSYLAKNEEDEAWKMASTVINLVIIIMLVCIGLGFLFTPELVKLVAHKFTGERLNTTIKLTRIMLPAVLFTGLNGFLMGMLNSYKHFLTPALGSVIYNIVIILSGYFLAGKLGITSFALGVVAGMILNFTVQVPSLARYGLKYRPVIDISHPGVVKMAKLMVPTLLGLAVSQINLIVNQNLASGLSEGSIMALRLANRLMYLPLGLFAAAISMAIFPTMTSFAARGEMENFKKSVAMGIKSIWFIILPAEVGLIVLSVPIVRLLFEMGAFTPEMTRATAGALVFYSLGLFAHSALQIILRGFYSLHDTLTPVTTSLITIFLNYILNVTFISYLGHRGLALGFSITGLFDFSILLWLFRRKVGKIYGKDILVSGLKSLMASLLMGVVAYSIAHYLSGIAVTKHGQLIQVGAAIAGGALVYAATTLFLKMEEAMFFLNLIRRKV